MVVRRHACPAPFGVLIGLGRQRHQGGPVDGVEELAAAGAEPAHQAGIEFVDQDADCDVQLGEREEASVTQPRQNPSLDDENRRLDLGLGESRQMHVVWERPRTKRFVSRIPFTPSAAARLS